LKTCAAWKWVYAAMITDNNVAIMIAHRMAVSLPIDSIRRHSSAMMMTMAASPTT